jgi:putative ABC transport system ATP-binding protein
VSEPVCHIRDAIVVVGAPPEEYRLEVEAFDLRFRECVALVAPSGSGKSLFLEMLALVREPQSAGRFELSRRDASVFDAENAWRARDLAVLNRHRRNEIGFLLQNGGLLGALNVRRNIMLPAQLARQDTRAALDLLDVLDLSRLSRRIPASLSGGERQRVALVRALAVRPALLLADEPTAALDPNNADRVLNLIYGAVKNYQMAGAAMIVTHDGERAARAGFRVLGMAVSASTSGGVGRLSACGVPA